MSGVFEVQWEQTIEKMKRRLQAGGKVIALGAFLSARKEALPILEQQNITPDAVGAANLDAMLADVMPLITPERVPAPIRRGITKKYLEALLTECTKEPVTDEEVKAGISKGESAHKDKVAARRTARASDERSDAGGSADARGDDAGDSGRSVDSSEVADDGTADDDDDDEAPEEEARVSHRAATRSPPRTQRAHVNHSTHSTEDTMRNDDQGEEQFDDDDEEQLDEVDTQPPSKRPRVRAPQPQVVVLQQQQPRAKAQRTQAAAPRNSFFPQNQDMLRIYKRIQGGKRSIVGEYTKEDIGPGVSLQMFLKDYIDEENREPNGRTTYECVAINSRGEEVGRPVQYVIESQPTDGGMSSPIGQAREMLDLINDLRGDEEERSRRTGDLLQEAKAKALGGGEVNFGNMMMLMFLEKMNAPRHDPEAIARLVLDKVQPQHQQPSMPFIMPTSLPPVQAAPPMSSALDKLMEASIAAMLKPAPSLADQLKEIQVLQTFLHPPQQSQTAELVAAIRQLGIGTTKTPEAAGVDSMMLNFEKIHTMVKTLAPQVNMGGLMGGFAGLLNNPEIQKAVGGFVSQVIPNPAARQPQPQLQQQLPQPQPAAAAAAPAPAQPQSPPVTPEMHDAAKRFAIAQTKEFRVDALMALMQAMYIGGWAPTMEPVLKQAQSGVLAPAQQFLAAIVQQLNPSLVTLDLINATLRASAVAAGDEGKRMLAALDVSDKGVQQPAATTPGAIETPNATVVPITSAPAHPHHAAYAAQVDALREQEKAAKAPHAPEVEVRERAVTPAAAAAEPVQLQQVAEPTPPTPPTPAEVVTFEKPAQPPQQSV